MANPFETYDFERATKIFDSLRARHKETAQNRAFVRGDDWQSGAGWVGPQFENGTRLGGEIKAAIAREFASKGSVRGAVRRHTRGVIGRIPTWSISPRDLDETAQAANEVEDELVGEAQTILNEFWKHARVHRTLKELVRDYLTNGRAVARLFFVQDDEAAAPVDIKEAVKRIYLFREDTVQACVAWDKKTLRRASFFRYEQDGRTFIEICFVDDDGFTVFRKLSNGDAKTFAAANLPTIAGYIADEGEEAFDPVVLPLNGNLLVFEMDGEPLVTGAMISQQKLVNKAYTMISHNLDAAGFRERVMLNALPPGEFKQNERGEKVFVPNPDGLEVGAGKVSFVQGVPTVERDADGKLKQSITTPSIFESDPIPIKTYTDTVDAGSTAILEDADQLHIKMNGEADAAGISREEAREAYKSSLEDTKSALDDFVSEIFECVLAVVGYLAGAPNAYDALQVTFSAILNAGPVSADERRVSMEEADKKYRSRESAMENIGITDPDAMKAKILQEEDEAVPEDGDENKEGDEENVRR